MAGNARFHDKIHRKSHHTNTTPGFPDSGMDPIASPTEPFQGTFVVNGMLSTNSGLQFLSANIPGNFECENLKARTYTHTNFLSGDSTETIISDGALTGHGNFTLTMDFGTAVYAKTPTFIATNNISAVNTVYSPTVNTNSLVVNSNASINGNLLVNGNLSALGDISVIETNIIGTSSLSVYNTGPSTAFVVTQSGSTPIAEFRNQNNKVLDVKTDGIIVSGTFVASDVVIAPNITNLSNTSGNWNSSYNSLTSTSANWNSVYSSTTSNSGNWNAAYTKVNSTSSNWDSNYSTVNSNSGRWESVYSSVSSNSANWGSVYSSVTPNSAKWESVYSSTNSNSGNWQSSYTTVNSNSGRWESVYGSVNSTSGNWDNTYTTVTSNSANWGSAYTKVNSSSSNWDTTYTAVNSNSGKWESVYSSTNSNSANWQSSYTTVNSNSSNWLSGKTDVDFVSRTGNFIDSVSTQNAHISSLYVTLSSLTASGTVTLTLTSPTYIFVETNGAQRDIELPATSTAQRGLTFTVKNTSALNNDVHVHYNGNVGGTPVAIIARDTFKQVIANGQTNSWLVL